MAVQTRSTRVKAPVISNPNNVPVGALSTNEKANLNLSKRVGFDKTLKFLLLIIKMIIIKY